MAQQHRHSQAEVLQSQWEDLRRVGSIMYDVLLWQDLTWPSLSLAWLPQPWQQPRGVAAAEAAARAARKEDFDEHTAAALEDSKQEETAAAAAAAAAAAGAAGRDVKQQQQPPTQLVQMPVDYQYLLLGSQTSGQGTAKLQLYRVEVPGHMGALQPQQQVLMQKGDMQLVMSIPHGSLDVNSLAVIPQQPNIVATCCDEPEVYLFDLRQHTVQEWDAMQRFQQEAADGDATHSSDDGNSDTGSDSNADSDQEPASPSDSEMPDAERPHPQAVLVGRSAGGFGLEFNPVKTGLLLGGDSQGGVQLWDVGALGSSSSSGSDGGSSSAPPARVQPLQAEEQFVPCGINDVSWHRHGTTYALATEDGQVWVQDLRAPLSNGNSSSSNIGGGSSRGALGLTHFKGSGVPAPSTAQVHVYRYRQKSLQQLQQLQQLEQPPDPGPAMKAKDCFCVAFDPQHDYRLASGGADGFVQILDLRRLDEPVESLGMHAGSVTSLAWSHSLPGLLVSAGEDGAVLLWDANRLQHKQPVAQQRGQQQQQQQGQGLNLPQPHHLRQLTASVQQQGHPGLLFMHGGHLGPVGGLALNPSRPWLVASSTGQMVEAADRAGNPVVIHRQPLMVWEVNRDNGLLC